MSYISPETAEAILMSIWFYYKHSAGISLGPLGPLVCVDEVLLVSECSFTKPHYWTLSSVLFTILLQWFLSPALLLSYVSVSWTSQGAIFGAASVVCLCDASRLDDLHTIVVWYERCQPACLEVGRVPDVVLFHTLGFSVSGELKARRSIRL